MTDGPERRRGPRKRAQDDPNRMTAHRIYLPEWMVSQIDAYTEAHDLSGRSEAIRLAVTRFLKAVARRTAKPGDEGTGGPAGS
jgi:hypothetical protein